MRGKPSVDKAEPNARRVFQSRVSSAALWRALRCATSTGFPALLGALTGNNYFGWAALGGFEATLADLGGSYQARFTAMGLLSIGGAFGLFLGMMCSGHLWLVFLCTVVWSFIWAYASVLGGTVNAFNALVVVIFLCGIETHVQSWTAPPTPHSTCSAAPLGRQRCHWWCGRSILIARLEWAVGKCYASLGGLLASTIELLRRKSADAKLWHRAARSHQYAMRNLLEDARTIIAASRAQELAENVRGEQLLVLLETVDVMLGYAIAATERAEQLQTHQVQTHMQQPEFLIGFFDRWRQSLLWVDQAAAHDKIPSAAAREQQRDEMRHLATLADRTGDPLIMHLAQMTADAMDVAIAAVFTVRTDVAVPTGAAIPIGPSHRTISLPTRPMWQTLREAWSWDGDVAPRIACKFCLWRWNSAGRISASTPRILDPDDLGDRNAPASRRDLEAFARTHARQCRGRDCCRRLDLLCAFEINPGAASLSPELCHARHAASELCVLRIVFDSNLRDRLNF